MPRTPIEAVSQDAPLSTAVGSAVRVLTLGGATLTTGLIAGVFYAYAVSVTLGLGVQPRVMPFIKRLLAMATLESPAPSASRIGRAAGGSRG